MTPATLAAQLLRDHDPDVAAYTAARRADAAAAGGMLEEARLWREVLAEVERVEMDSVQ